MDVHLWKWPRRHAAIHIQRSWKSLWASRSLVEETGGCTRAPLISVQIWNPPDKRKQHIYLAQRAQALNPQLQKAVEVLLFVMMVS